MLVLFFGFLAHGAAASSDALKAPAGSGLPFAIADFDGDLRPDFASIHAGAAEFSGTDYWVQLQLSAAGRQSIEIVAPTGGLQIAARDVNGDRAVDLVLSTTLLKQPVAILLNNGHGSFTWAPTAAFPGAFRESETNCTSGGYRATSVAGVPPQSRTTFSWRTLGRPCPLALASFLPLSSPWFSGSAFQHNHSGRAPPSRVPQS